MPKPGCTCAPCTGITLPEFAGCMITRHNATARAVADKTATAIEWMPDGRPVPAGVAEAIREMNAWHARFGWQ